MFFSFYLPSYFFAENFVKAHCSCSLVKMASKDGVAELVLVKYLIDVDDEAEEDCETAPVQSSKCTWMKPWLLERQRLGFKTIYDDIELWGESRFKESFRMTKTQFNLLMTKIGKMIARTDTHMCCAVPAKTRLQITLRYLATGSSFGMLEEVFRVSRSTISRIIPDVCSSLWMVLRVEYLKCPQSEEQWLHIAEGFWRRWQYPHCLGAVDGKHIEVRAFGNSGTGFYNYKNTFSINLMAMADSRARFLLVDIGAPGSRHDSGVLQDTAFYRAMTAEELEMPRTAQDGLEVNYHIIGDDGFKFTDRLFKPYSGRELSRQQKIYNYRFSRARRIIENAFGILTSRFRVLRQPIQQSYLNVVKTVQGAVILHNFLIDSSCGEDIDGSIDSLTLENSDAHQVYTHNSSDMAHGQRDRLARFFMEEGKVPFQEKMAFRTS